MLVLFVHISIYPLFVVFGGLEIKDYTWGFVLVYIPLTIFEKLLILDGHLSTQTEA